MKNSKTLKLTIIITLTTITLVLGLLAYTNRIQKNKLAQNNINALNSGNVTTIDITGITPSPESQHEHIYKTHYDDTKHWEECTVCGTKRNEQTHSLTTTWALRA